MLTLDKAKLDKIYTIIRVTTDWRNTQNLGNLGIYPGVQIKLIQRMHDLYRVAVGIATYVFSESTCKNIHLMPV